MSVFNDARTVRRAVCENDWIESKQRTYSACAQRKAKSSAIEPLVRKIGRRSPQSSSAPVTRSSILAPRGLKELRAGRRRFSAPAEKSAYPMAFSGRRVGYAARKIRGIGRRLPQSSSAPVARSSILAPRGLQKPRAKHRRSSHTRKYQHVRTAFIRQVFRNRRLICAARTIRKIGSASCPKVTPLGDSECTDTAEPAAARPQNRKASRP